MLDVHPPHQAAHSWRDFFIHIATIVIGLLIAIGLEQTVEAIHHARERATLVAELRDECAHNRQVVDTDMAAFRSRRRWGTDSVNILRNAIPSGGFISVTLPAQTGGPPYSPSRSVWTIAKANGTAALLPDNVASIFDRIDYAAQGFVDENQLNNVAETDTEAFEVRVGIRVIAGASLRLSLADRDDLIRKLSHHVAQYHACAVWAAFWGYECQAVIDGVTRREQLQPYLAKATAEANKL